MEINKLVNKHTFYDTEKVNIALILQLIACDGLFLAANLSNNNIINFIGLMLLLLVLMFNTIENDFLLLIALLPSMSIITIGINGIGFLGVGFVFLYLKMILIFKNLTISFSDIVFSGILLFLSGIRLVTVGYYDFAICCEIIILILTIKVFLKQYMDDCLILLEVIKSFVWGTFLMLLNTLPSVVLSQMESSRFGSLNDNANYTAVNLAYVLVLLIFLFVNKLNIKHMKILFIIFLAFGLWTGSRGFVVAFASGFVLILLTTGFLKKRTIAIIIALLTMLFLFYCMYKIGNSFVVNIVDNTLIRTIQNLSNPSGGYYTDVSSGRIYLWNCYYDLWSKNIKTILVGYGMMDYPTRIGMGQFSHNEILGSLIGVGIVGTVSICVLYWNLFAFSFKVLTKKIHIKKILHFFSLPLCATAGYMFLDGLLDLRMPIYFMLPGMVYILLNSSTKNY